MAQWTCQKEDERRWRGNTSLALQGLMKDISTVLMSFKSKTTCFYANTLVHGTSKQVDKWMCKSVHVTVRAIVRADVRAEVRASVYASARKSVRASAGVRASV